MALDPITAALDIGGRLIDKLWPDPAQRDIAKLKLMELQQSGELALLSADTQLALGQQKINEIDAASARFFNSGWRPFVGWICGGALAYQLIARPLLIGFLLRDFPALDVATLLTLLGTLLGIGGMRTAEKFRLMAK